MRLQVAVGILIKDGKLLIQQRREGTDCAGQWEFPGGKIESDETPEMALLRELREELNIEIQKLQALTLLNYDYAHAAVALHTYLIKSWEGEVCGYEGQKIRWLRPEEALEYDLLEAAYPLLEVAKQHMGILTR